jgi:FixJ family two-component response regulator
MRGSRQNVSGGVSADKLKVIVIVDDDDGVRDSTRVLLEACGYATEGFASADDYLAKSAGTGGDCLLLDVQMPGMSGIELLEHMRAQGNPTPVVLMTANIERLGDRPAQAGAVTVLRKPFAEDALLSWIARACGQQNA